MSFLEKWNTVRSSLSPCWVSAFQMSLLTAWLGFSTGPGRFLAGLMFSKLPIPQKGVALSRSGICSRRSFRFHGDAFLTPRTDQARPLVLAVTLAVLLGKTCFGAWKFLRGDAARSGAARGHRSGETGGISFVIAALGGERKVAGQGSCPWSYPSLS